MFLESKSDFIESVLRGAARILGCNSATLVLINEKGGKIRIALGTKRDSEKELEEVQSFLGDVQQTTFAYHDVKDSLVVKTYKERKIFETTSLGDLVCGAFTKDAVLMAEEFLGEHRFICIPVLSGSRCLGAIVFEKAGIRAFSPGQRELMLRYASRIGQVLGEDNDNASNIQTTDNQVIGHLLCDESGMLLGSTEDAVEVIKERLQGDLPTYLRAILSEVTACGHTTILKHGFGVRVFPMNLGMDKIYLLSFYKADKDVGMKGLELYQVALADRVPAVILDPEHRIASCNKAFEELFGYDYGSLLGYKFELLFRDLLDARSLLDHTQLSPHNGYFERNSVLCKRDGTIFIGRVETLLLADKDGDIDGFLILVKEQSKLLDNHDEIERVMRTERLATMGEMAAQLAHQIRNPLLSIGAGLDQIMDEIGDNENVREIVAEIKSEVLRMDMTLRDYLSLAGKHDVMLSKVNIHQVVDDAIKVLKRSRLRENVEIRYEGNKDVGVFADHEGLRQVFINLFQNAQDAMPNGGKIICYTKVTDNDVIICVDDQGIGLSCPPERCFEPFFTTKRHGSGLGLTFCRRVIQAHGGTITISSREGGGCRVTMIFPRRFC